MTHERHKQNGTPRAGADIYEAKEPSTADIIDLSRLFHILRQKRHIVLLCLMFSVAMAALYLYLATPIYQSSSIVEMHPRRPRIMTEDGAYVEDPMSPNLITDELNTQFHKMQGESVREAAAQELRKNAEQIPQLSGFGTVDELRAFLANVMGFSRISGTYLVQITASSDSPEFASALANTYARVAAEVVKESTRTAAMEAVHWLEGQIVDYERQLLNDEAKLIAFSQKHNIEGQKSAKLTAEASLLTINAELVSYETQATTLMDMVKNLESVKADPQSAGILPTSIPRADIIQQRLKEFTDAESELEALRMTYTDKHPQVNASLRLVATLRAELEREIDRARETTKANLSLINAYVKSIQKTKRQQIELAEKIQQSINQYDIDAIPLQKSVEASGSSYNGLLQRIEQARLATDEETSLLSVYELAHESRSPVRPKKKLIVAIALVLGFGGGVVLAILIHTLQDRVNSIYDVEVELGQNLLGVIPHVKTKMATTEMAKVSLTDKFSLVSEALAGLRAALVAQGHPRDKAGWALLVAGIAPMEGKTSLSCNLAVTMARTYKKVFLIDGDMRRPMLHKVFDVPVEHQGLMEALVDPDSGPEEFARLPHPTEVPNLHVTLGHPVDGISPTEVLETGKFEQFLQWARENYDVVIIDSPPMGIISDPLVYGRLVDDVILVCRYNKSRKAVLQQGIRALRKNSCPLIGLVINDYRAGAIGHGYGYGYGYGYGKEYSYAGSPNKA